MVRARSASNIAALLELGEEAVSVEEPDESAGVTSVDRGWMADSRLRFAGVEKISAGSREMRMRASACEDWLRTLIMTLSSDVERYERRSSVSRSPNNCQRCKMDELWDAYLVALANHDASVAWSRRMQCWI